MAVKTFLEDGSSNLDANSLEREIHTKWVKYSRNANMVFRVCQNIKSLKKPERCKVGFVSQKYVIAADQKTENC